MTDQNQISTEDVLALMTPGDPLQNMGSGCEPEDAWEDGPDSDAYWLWYTDTRSNGDRAPEPAREDPASKFGRIRQSLRVPPVNQTPGFCG